jgi:hypothetical protein
MRDGAAPISGEDRRAIRRVIRVDGRPPRYSIIGGRKRPFSFSTIGQLAAIGKRTGVARIFGFNFSGFIARWL